MGDTDGSSMAAQGARNRRTAVKMLVRKPGFFSNSLDALSSQSDDEARTANGHEVDTKVQPRGMINLRRMRVEDVAIPTAEITVCPLQHISKDELGTGVPRKRLVRIPGL